MKLFLRSILFFSIASFAPLAFGQTLYYTGGINISSNGGQSKPAGDGNFNSSANWSTVVPSTFMTGGVPGIPGSSTIAVIQADVNNGSVFYLSPNSAFISLTSVPVLINQNQSNSVAALLVSNYGFFGQGSGIVNFTNNSGTLNVNGGNSLTTGNFVVDGGVTLNYSGGPFTVSKGLIVVGDDSTFTQSANNTLGGSGTFNIQSGSFNYDTAAGSPTQMIVGYSQNNNTLISSGTTGAVTQGATGASSSTVTMGSSTILGYDSGAGNWTLKGGSMLQTGTLGTSYSIALGSNGGSGGLTGIGSVGTLTINDTSTFNLGTAGSSRPVDLQLGTLSTGAGVATTGGTGNIVQNGNGSTVNFAGGATTVEVGDTGGGTGTYQLTAGTLNIGTGANDAVTFALGATVGSNGTLSMSQANGNTTILNVGSAALTNSTSFTVGGVGTGTFNMNGGTANFFKALNIGPNGTVALNGGTLAISTDNLVSTGGTLNLGGGTLALLSGASPTYNYSFNGSLTGGTSTIDASQAGLTTFTFANGLSGTGGITLKGNGSTVFNFADVGAGAANTYSGSTGIIGGTLNATAADFAGAVAGSTLTIGATGSPAILNLGVGPTSVNLPLGISGNGTFNVNFNAPNETLTLSGAGSSLSTVNIVLGANTGPVSIASAMPGTLQVYNGSFGTISGTGSSVTIGDNTGTTSGSVTFGTTTYTGLTTVNQQFSLTANNLNGSAVNNGTLNVTNNIGLLTTDTVTNTGTLTAGSISGVVTSNTGMLTTGSIGSDVTSNTGTLTVTGVGGIGGNVVSNAGFLTTTTVTGNVTNSGIFTGSSAVGTIGGSLNNTGTVMSSAPLPGVIDTPTFNVGSTLTSSGTLVIRTNGAIADDFQAGGAVNLNNGTIQVQVVGGGKIGTTTYDIVNGTSVSDTGITLSQDTALFSFALNNTGTSEQLIVTQSPIAAYALTPNQQAVAGAIDGTNSSLFSYFSQIPLGTAATSIPTILDQLSPQSLQYARNIAFENSTFLVQRMNGVDADLRSGYAGLDTSAISLANPGFESGLGRSLSNLFASDGPFHQAAPNGVNYYPGGAPGGPATESPSPSPEPATESTWSPSSQVISDSPNPYLANQDPSGPEAPKMNEFIGGDAILADLNQDQNAANAPASKARYTAADLTAGVGFRVASHFTAGVLFDYNHTDAKTDSYGSRTRIDTYAPGIFATYSEKGFYANGLFSFGYNDYSNSRALPFIGPSTTANSSPNGQQYVGSLDAGYDFHPNKAWIVGPAAGLTYTHLDVDSFTETGAPGADLDVNSQSADSLRSRLGGHAVFQTNTGDVLLQPNITAMWQHEFMADASGITSNFADFASNPFTIQTAAPSRDSALIGVGLTATLNTSMALYLNYLADIGASDYFAQTVYGGVKARF
jgi:fibronectin-binding autotransporter adhesin